MECEEMGIWEGEDGIPVSMSGEQHGYRLKSTGQLWL